jgi:DNA recombination protein RmuC
LEKQKDLGLFASGKKVAAATASSLIPILKAIESLWAINTTQKNIEEVIKTGKKLHSQAVAFGEEMQKIGSALNTSQRAYDDALTKLQGKQGIVYYAKHLEDLGAKSNKQLSLDSDLEEK